MEGVRVVHTIRVARAPGGVEKLDPLVREGGRQAWSVEIKRHHAVKQECSQKNMSAEQTGS